MSTRNRYAKIVWRALKKMNSDDVMGGYHVCYTAAQVAAIGEVSTPTAKKYLEIFVKRGDAKKFGNGKTALYAYNSEGVLS